MITTFVLAALGWAVGLLTIGLFGRITWPRLARHLDGQSPARRYRAALAFALAPLPAATLIVLLVLLPGVLGLAWSGADHCLRHADHAHLCLVHGLEVAAVWLAVPLLVALAWIGVAALLRQGRDAPATRALRALEAVARPHGDGDPSLCMVDSDSPLALTHGRWRPRTLVSRALARALAPDEWAALVAHERAHVRRAEPRWRWLAQLGSTPLAPSTRRQVLAELVLASEQICDAEAARRTDPLAVARAILHVERLMAGTPAPAFSTVGIADGGVTARIDSLLADAAPTPTASRAGVWAVGVGLLALAGLLGSTMHHVAEHALSHPLSQTLSHSLPHALSQGLSHALSHALGG